MHKARPKFPHQLVLGLAAVEEIVSSGDFRSLFYLYAEVRAAYTTHPVTVYGKDLTEMRLNRLASGKSKRLKFAGDLSLF